MTGAGREQLIERIKEAADIVDVVGESVALRRSGRYYSGLCPFHAEKTPSFYVDPQRQMFHCFGCGTGGDVIKFVMQHRGLSFAEALEFLAERYNVRIEVDRFGRGADGRSILLQYVSIAEDFYYRQLRYGSEGGIARDYLKKRQIGDRIVEEQRLGYAPKSWDALVKHFQSKGLDLQKGVELGLFGVASGRAGGGFYDRFRHRLIFPIRNANGEVVAFGGRRLEDGTSTDEPKYLNSPESDLYKKRSILYQFHLAREACRREKRQIILVEGYMDALAFHKAGFYRTVATLGTALTSQQARLIKRIADEVVLVYDGDEPGRKAMVRNFPVLAQEGIKSSCVILPEGMDPDDFFRDHSIEDFEALMESRKDLGEFAVEEIIKTWDGSTAGKLKVLSELFPYLEAVGQPVVQMEYLRLAGILLNLSEEVILKQFNTWLLASKSGERNAISSVTVKKPGNRVSVKNNRCYATSDFSVMVTTSVEEEILKILIAYPHFIEETCRQSCWHFLIENLSDGIKDEGFLSKPVRLILRAIHEKWLEFSSSKKDNNQFPIDKICDRINDPKAQALFSRMVFECRTYDNESTAFILLNDYLKALEKKIVKARREQLIRELAEAEKKGDVESIRTALRKIQSLGGVKSHEEPYEKADRGMVRGNEHDFQ